VAPRSDIVPARHRHHRQHHRAATDITTTITTGIGASGDDGKSGGRPLPVCAGRGNEPQYR
jgi:hypothetical protein